MPTTNKQIPTLLAQGISLLCHPLTMAVWMALATMFGLAGPLSYPMPVRWYVVGTVTFMTLIVPCLFVWLLRLFGVMHHGEGDTRRLRIMMMVVMAVCYTCCGWVFDNVAVLFLVRKILYSATAVVFLLVVCEFFYPLSCHTTALGALLGMMWMLLYVGNTALLVPFIIGIVAVGLLATARLYLTGCRVGSVAWGALLGFALSAIMLVVI